MSIVNKPVQDINHELNHNPYNTTLTQATNQPITIL